MAAPWQGDTLTQPHGPADPVAGVGILLGAAFFGTLMWLLTRYKIIPAESATAIIWITLACMAALLAVGMSWSHIRRRMSGRVDVDDVTDG